MPRRSLAVAAGLTAGLVGLTAAHGATADPPHHSAAKHVLLLSVDGLHQSDLAYYMRHAPALGAGRAGRPTAPTTRRPRPPSRPTRSRGWSPS